MNELATYSQYPTIMNIVTIAKVFFLELLSCLSIKNKNIDIIIINSVFIIFTIVHIDSTKRKYLIFDCASLFYKKLFSV